MDPVERLLIERECQRLVTAYAQTVDLERGEGLPDIFTEDGLMALPDQEMRGGAALRDMLQAMDANIGMRHVCTNIRIDVVSETEARGLTYLTAYVGPKGEDGQVQVKAPFAVGEYRDVYHKTPGGWRIAERRFTQSFTGA